MMFCKRGMRSLLFGALAESICMFLMCPPSGARGETGVISQDYIVRNWDTGSGLPDNSVGVLLSTRDGYIWFGTPAGLVRFDGVRFRVYDERNTPSLKDSRILSIYEDITGVLWVGTDGGGLCSIVDGEWRSFGEGEGLLDGHIRAIVGDRDGILWAGTDYGLHRMEAGRFQVYGLDEGLTDDILTALVLDGFNRLWAGTMWGGLARFEEGLIKVYGPGGGLGDPRILSLCADAEVNLWIGTMKGLFHLKPYAESIGMIVGTGRYPVTALAVGPDGGLLVGTMVEGLKILDESGPRDLLPGHGFSDGHVKAILTDENGYVWIGTDSKGLFQVAGRKIGSITTAEGLPEESVYAVLGDDDGSLWIGTENSGLYVLRSGRIRKYADRKGGLAGDMVRTLSRDRFGRIIVGTMDGGLSILTPDRIINITSSEGLGSDNVTAVLHDSEGAVWIGTERGLRRSMDGRVEAASKFGDLEGRTIRTLYESEGGKLYAGTREGLWRLSGSSSERMIVGERVLELDAISLFEESDGRLWIGTNGEGLRCLTDKGVTSYTTADGLPGMFIYSIIPDSSNRLWMSCESGVFSMDRDSLTAYPDGKVRILAPTLYNEFEGMPSGRCNGFCSPAVLISITGDWFYPTKGGVAVLDRESRSSLTHRPGVLLESVNADGTELDIDEDIELTYGTGLIEIRFTAIDYSAPAKCRFLYALDGFNSVFKSVHPGQRRTAQYRGLDPGEYVFTVNAIGNSGNWSEEPATLSFVILPPFYRRLWFIVLLVAVAMVAAAAAAALRKYRRITRQKAKYSTSTINEERMEAALDRLKCLIEEEKIYLDPDITLKKLAQRLNIHYNHLSRIINEKFGVSFNHYINRFRIEEAQKRLLDPDLEGKSILDIMYDVGFYSKSTFNSAFKRFTGCSPSQYRRRHR